MAAFHQFTSEEAWVWAAARRFWRAAVCLFAVFYVVSEVRLLLGFSEFGDDFGPAAFGTFLLGYGIVGTGQTRLTAIAAWLTTIATNLGGEDQSREM